MSESVFSALLLLRFPGLSFRPGRILAQEANHAVSDCHHQSMTEMSLHPGQAATVSPRIVPTAASQ
jgi:hypothetical protein